MQGQLKERADSGHGQRFDHGSVTSAPLAIQSELDNILGAASFRSSRRCSEFLRFVVQETLEGRQEDLKERTLGVSLFGRPADYETPGDPIVRVTANDVRKRLAQYYDDHAGSTLRIDLAPGSYVPVFRRSESPASALLAPAAPVVSAPVVSAPAKARRANLWWLLLSLALVVSAASVWRSRQKSPLETFWSPVFTSDRSPILCVGTSSHVWVVSDHLSAQLSSTLGQASQPVSVAIDPHEALPAADGYFSLGSVKAALGLSAFLSQKGVRPQLRMAGPLTLDDFHDHTIVTVGAFSNPWALERTSEMRFRFGREIVGGKSWLNITDSQDAKRKWRVQESPFATPSEDYALVTRIIDPGSGKVFLSLAGLNQFGTEAAEEFVTNGDYWNDIVAHAPKGWQSKNLQVLLQTSVVESRPTPPRVVAVYFW